MQRKKEELWREAEELFATLLRLSMEADHAFSEIATARSQKIFRVAIHAGERALRRLQAIVREQEARDAFRAI